MSDPLGLIGQGRGVGNASGAGFTPAIGREQAIDPVAPSFKDVLLQNIDQVNKLQQEANSATEDLMTGKRMDLEGVVLATQKADTAFRMLLSVRNKVQQAFEEIKQLRV